MRATAPRRSRCLRTGRSLAARSTTCGRRSAAPPCPCSGRTSFSTNFRSWRRGRRAPRQPAGRLQRGGRGPSPAVADSARPVRAKICGLTRAQDAAVAVAAGADYLGVVFAGGPRHVTAQAAAEVTRAAGAVPVFGVFGEQSVDEILRITRAAALAGAQLHGSYRREDAARLRAEGLRVWRVARLAGPEDLGLLREAAVDAD